MRAAPSAAVRATSDKTVASVSAVIVMVEWPSISGIGEDHDPATPLDMPSTWYL
jgi:hypothetical protein